MVLQFVNTSEGTVLIFVKTYEKRVHCQNLLKTGRPTKTKLVKTCEERVFIQHGSRIFSVTTWENGHFFNTCEKQVLCQHGLGTFCQYIPAKNGYVVIRNVYFSWSTLAKNGYFVNTYLLRTQPVVTKNVPYFPSRFSIVGPRLDVRTVFL